MPESPLLGFKSNQFTFKHLCGGAVIDPFIGITA